MIQVVPYLIVSFIMMVGVGPSHAEHNSVSQLILPIEAVVFLVDRESAMPPSESHSGRVSSSPEANISKDRRKSSLSSGVGEKSSNHSIPQGGIESGKELRPSQDRVRDPFKGGGESHSVLKKRSGVRR